MEIKIKETIVNYFSLEKWLLVDFGKGDTYIPEKKYNELTKKVIEVIENK